MPLGEAHKWQYVEDEKTFKLIFSNIKFPLQVYTIVWKAGRSAN